MPYATFVAWVYPTSDNIGSRQTVLSDDDGNNDREILIEQWTSNWAVFTGDTAPNSQQTAPVDLGQWQQVAAVYTPLSVTFYKNGVFFGTYPVSGQGTTANFTIGRNPGYYFAEYFNGKIDEVRLYNRSLSPSEIQQLYVSNLEKYDSGKWQFTTRQTFGLFPAGDYNFTYFGCASDIAGNQNCTDTRQLTYHVENPQIAFVPPTPDNATITMDPSILINISLNQTTYPFNSFVFDWNGSSTAVPVTVDVAKTGNEEDTISLSCPIGTTISSYTSTWGVGTACGGGAGVPCGSCGLGTRSCTINYAQQYCGGTDCAPNVNKPSNMDLTCSGFAPNDTIYSPELVLMYNFDNYSIINSSNTVVDSSGNGDDATCGSPNCPVWTPNGVYGGAYNMSGGAYLQFDVTPQIPVGSDPITMCTWANHANVDDNGMEVLDSLGPITDWNGVDSFSSMYIGRYFGTGDLSGGLNGDALRVPGYWDTLGTNSWVQICLTYDGTNAELYADGQNVTPPTPKSWSTIAPLGSPGFVGSSGDLVWHWNGTEDDLRIYNYSLSPADIHNLYISNFSDTSNLVLHYDFDNSSAVRLNGTADASMYSDNATCTDPDCPSWTPDGKYGGAYHFDGVNDNFTLGNLDHTPVTVSTWIKRDRTSVPGGEAIIYTQNIGGWGLGIAADNTVFFDWAGNIVLGDSTGTVADNNWHQLTVTYDGTTATFYIDGVASGSASSYNPVFDSGGGNYIVGGMAFPGFSQNFQGTIDEIRVYNRTLAPSEIQQLYVSNLNNYDNDKWDFVTNQTFGHFPAGDYNFSYFGCVTDLAGNQNCTENRTITYHVLGPQIAFAPPTPDNGSTILFAPIDDTNDGQIPINVSVNMTTYPIALGVFDWNGTNYTMPGDGSFISYQFDVNDPSNTPDTSPFGNNATCSGACPTWVPSGEFNGGYHFDGGDLLDVPNNPTLNPNVITMSVWVNPDTITGGNEYLVSKPLYNHWYGYPYAEYALRINPDGTIGCWVSNYDNILDSNTAISSGSWSLITCTYDGSEEKVYIDGVLDNSLSISEPIQASTQDLAIGSRSTTNPGESFQGTMDDVEIYNRVLSDSDVADLYTSTPSSLPYSPSFYYETNISPDLPYGVYNFTYYACAYDQVGSENCTETRTLTYDDRDCPLITDSGTFTMENNFVGQPNDASEFEGGSTACVKIAASNVVFDCNGYNITATSGGYGSLGIFINGSATNVTVQNCPSVSGYGNGVMVYQSNNDTLANISVKNTSFEAFQLYQSSSDNLTNDSVDGLTDSSITYSCFYVSAESTDNSLQDDNGYSCNTGFQLNSDCTGNNITDSLAYNNSEGFYIPSFGDLLIDDVAIAPSSGGGDGFGMYGINNTFINDTASGYRVDFGLSQGTGNILVNNTAYGAIQNYGNGGDGFAISNSGNTLIGNIAYNNSYDGFDITPTGFFGWSNTENNVLINNTAYGNSNAGLEFRNPYNYGYLFDDNSIQGMHLYNNTFDAEISNAAGNPSYAVQLLDMAFDNPIGGYANYTTLSINDMVIGNENYTMTWLQDPGALPDRSFNEKFVNIVDQSGNSSIDSISWSWLDSELAGYDEPYLRLFNYNSSWGNLNATLDTTDHTLSLANLAPAGQYAIFQLVNCPVISQSGTYYQDADYTGAPRDASEMPEPGMACVKIDASDVVFDCGVYTTTNNGTAGTTYGMLINDSVTDVTLRHCNVSQYSNGIYDYKSTDSVFTNNTLYNNSEAGMEVHDSDNPLVDSSHLYDNGYDLVVSDDSGSPMPISLAYVIFDNPAGNYNSFTNLSINDSVDDGQSYFINWSAMPGEPVPLDHVSFQSKFVNITPITGPLSIDTVVWSWLENETSGYNESNFQIWSYTSGWSNVSSIVDAVGHTLTVIGLDAPGGYGPLESAENIQLTPVNIANQTNLPRWNGTEPGNLQLNPGNITPLNLSATLLTNHWAGIYGNITSEVVLRSNLSVVYSWTWTPQQGGIICASTNSSLLQPILIGANGTDIDTAWEMTGDSDSGNNTFVAANCTMTFGSLQIANASYATTGNGDGFYTCLFKEKPSQVPVKANMVFCSNIINDGTLWDGQTGNFEMMVPTSGMGATEVYYMYASIQ